MKSHYASLWLLLALALIVILTVAFAGDISLGGYTLKKAPFEEMLLSEENSDSILTAEKADSLLAENHKVKTDSSAQSLLIIGDSMTLNLALRLAQYARHNGHTVNAVNWDSSSTVVWAASDTLQYYIREFHPTYIFIALGSNELFLRMPEVRRPQVEQILKKIGDIPFVWIGPPNWQKDSGFNDMLEKMLPRGTFFRSEGMKFERKADHIHPTRKSSALWMDSIMRWMPKSAHPILADTPPDTIGKCKPNVIYLKPKHK